MEPLAPWERELLGAAVDETPKATAKRNTVTREVVQTVEVEQIVLTLTPEEATTLLDVTRNISGPYKNTRRRHTDNIMTALVAAGVRDTSVSHNGWRPSDLKGTIDFS